MNWLADRIGRQAAKGAIRAVENAFENGAFDNAIGKIIADTVRDCGDDGLTHNGFLLKMTVELIDRSVPPLTFRAAREMADNIYTQFRKDNGGVRFGDPDWDWSGSAARTLADEYEIQYWEPTP